MYRTTLNKILTTVVLCIVGRQAIAAPAGMDWPQWRGANRDGVWKETGIVSKFSGPEIKVKWRVPVSKGYSGPTVADGRVYVTDRQTDEKQVERVLCFDAETGKPLWSHTYDCIYKGISYPNGPRASVTVQDGRAYSLGTMGNLFCFDAKTGKILWSKDTYGEYKIRMPDWGIAAAPLVEGDLVIVMLGGENACLVAFDRKTGKEAWRALPDRATYSAPVVIEQGGKRILVCWTAARIAGLEPSTGKLLWEQPFPAVEGMPVDGVGTPSREGDLLLVSSVYKGTLLMRLTDKPGVEKVWEKAGKSPEEPDVLHSLIPTPILKGGHIYGINYFGELRCLDAKTGKRVWEETSIVPKAMWAAAHLIQHGDKVWLFTEKGELIIAELSPKGYKEISRAKLIAPTRGQLNQRGGVAWSHPAFAYQHVFARNDEELLCASLKAEG
jgi:outer membrane protein assembly factor BamB